MFFTVKFGKYPMPGKPTSRGGRREKISVSGSKDPFFEDEIRSLKAWNAATNPANKFDISLAAKASGMSKDLFGKALRSEERGMQAAKMWVLWNKRAVRETQKRNLSADEASSLLNTKPRSASKVLRDIDAAEQFAEFSRKQGIKLSTRDVIIYWKYYKPYVRAHLKPTKSPNRKLLAKFIS